MKRLIFIFASLLLISCAGADGFDEQDSRNPLSESVLQSTAEAGGEAVIQWNGFTEDVGVILVNADGDKYEMVVDVVTASGLVFFIPEDLPAGVYKVTVSMAGKISELGEIEVTAPEMKPDDKEEPEPTPEPEPEPTPDPEPEPEPTPEPEPEPEPEIPSGPKVLKRIEYYSPYGLGSQQLRAWDITRTPVQVLRVSEYVVDSGGQDLDAFDEYTGTTAGYFEITTDGLEISNHVEMTYHKDSDDKVTGADVLPYGKSATTRYTWEYDAQQRLSEITYVHSSKGEISLASLTYDAGCLTGFDGISFEYNDPSLVNAEGAADVVWGYMALCKAHVDPALFIPYLMGWYNVTSTSLPTTMILPASSGEGTVSCALNYSFDEDGRVVSVSWKEGTDNLKMAYIYE